MVCIKRINSSVKYTKINEQTVKCIPFPTSNDTFELDRAFLTTFQTQHKYAKTYSIPHLK